MAIHAKMLLNTTQHCWLDTTRMEQVEKFLGLKSQLGTTSGPEAVHEAETQGHCRGPDPALSSQGDQLYLDSSKNLKP